MAWWRSGNLYSGWYRQPSASLGLHSLPSRTSRASALCGGLKKRKDGWKICNLQNKYWVRISLYDLASNTAAGSDGDSNRDADHAPQDYPPAPGPIPFRDDKQETMVVRPYPQVQALGPPQTVSIQPGTPVTVPASTVHLPQAQSTVLTEGQMKAVLKSPMPSRLIAPAPVVNQAHIPKVPGHITVTIESSIAPTPSIPVATISGQQGNLHHLMPANIQIIRGSAPALQIGAPPVPPQTFTSHLPRGAAAAAVMSSSKTVLRPATGASVGPGPPTVQHIIHQSIQSRPAVTTSTPVIPTVVASRTQSPVISSAVSHSTDIVHGRPGMTIHPPPAAVSIQRPPTSRDIATRITLPSHPAIGGQKAQPPNTMTQKSIFSTVTPVAAATVAPIVATNSVPSTTAIGSVPHSQMTSNTLVTMTVASHSSHATAVTTSTIPVAKVVPQPIAHSTSRVQPDYPGERANLIPISGHRASPNPVTMEPRSDRPTVPVQFQYFLPAYSSSYPLTHTYTPISSSVSTIRQYPAPSSALPTQPGVGVATTVHLNHMQLMAVDRIGLPSPQISTQGIQQAPITAQGIQPSHIGVQGLHGSAPITTQGLQQATGVTQQPQQQPQQGQGDAKPVVLADGFVASPISTTFGGTQPVATMVQAHPQGASVGGGPTLVSSPRPSILRKKPAAETCVRKNLIPAQPSDQGGARMETAVRAAGSPRPAGLKPKTEVHIAVAPPVMAAVEALPSQPLEQHIVSTAPQHMAQALPTMLSAPGPVPLSQPSTVLSALPAAMAVTPPVAASMANAVASPTQPAASSTVSCVPSSTEIKIKQEAEPMDTSSQQQDSNASLSLAPTLGSQAASMATSAPGELIPGASPRKKPRKQQHVISTEESEMMETNSTDEEKATGRPITGRAERRESPPREYVDEEGVRYVQVRPRPPVTLLRHYRNPWKAAYHHFQRYSDIRVKEDKKGSLQEMANQKGVACRAQGWKIHLCAAQLRQLTNLEHDVYSRLSTLQEGLIPKKRAGGDDDLHRINELIQGNMQRCKLVMDQVTEARDTMMKVLDHKDKVLKLLNKNGAVKKSSKLKRKERAKTHATKEQDAKEMSSMMHLSKGDFVWVDTGSGIPIGAEVKVTDTGQLQLIDDEGKVHKIDKKKEVSIRPMHPTAVKGVDDMIRLGDLNEAGLLRNLLVRHKEGIIYTYTGSILVAVNPYQLLPLYTTEHVHMYTDRRLGELPPHVFAIADSCFFNMRRNQRNQCCVISGESGAGKTESTKLILQFLAAVSGQHSWIEQQILEANPILEAFGNAKTVRNDNSSRFGKYIDINFTEGGAIEGARIEQYLLEKSRVCHQAPEERNYHIFYYMLMGMSAEQKKTLSLGTTAEYNYLTMGKCTSCEGRDDIKEFAHFRSALKILMFTESDSWEIYKLLAAILHLGNVRFEGTIVNNMESCDIKKSSHFNMTGKLLEVEPKSLGKGLTERSLMTNRECVTRSLTSAQAVDGRDAFVKAIYGRLFIWIVDKINEVIYKPETEDSNRAPNSIGLLDIFGFENFKNNSFEQLCINYANEQLQQFFVRHVFKLEQEEYARESIVWERVDYKDNQHTLDVLASKPLNMLSLIDEESSFPKGTDTTMLQKINQVHGKGGVYVPPKNDYETQFGVRHFAGEVYYDSKGFLEKNRDALSSDLIQVVETSDNKLLKQIFHNEVSTNSGIKSSANPRMIINASKSSLRQMNDGKKRVPTLTYQFRQSLESLMKTLTVCQPYFIRCVKPNDFKKPMLFDRDLCMRQLRYSGMMETIRIRKAGYPVRYTFSEFLDRYRVLLKSSVCDPKKESKQKCCESICHTVLTGEGDWKTGKTKIFLKDFHDTMLELERMNSLHTKALLIQKVLRGFKYRKEFLRKRSAALVIQKHWRGHKGRKLYRTVKLGFGRLQAKVRSRQLQFQYKRKREAAVLLQTQIRGFLARKEWRRKQSAVLLLQARLRRALRRKAERKKFTDMKKSAAEKAAEQQEILRKQKYLNEVLEKKREEKDQTPKLTDQEIDSIFDVIPEFNKGFEKYDRSRMISEEIDIDEELMLKYDDQDDFDDLDEYSFSKFASVFFQGAATYTHIRQRLREPLLHHEDEGDVMAALTVWWIILRFMGDLPEPKNPVQVNQRGQRNDVRSQTGVDVLIGEGPTLDRPLTTLEKLHIIVRYAILRSDLRDEIYCQICKQVQENNNRNSYFRGWILLSLCLGIFPPSEKFAKYLQSFIRFAPSGYSSYCAERLRRTVQNGVRSEPPSWLELQATKTKKPIVVTLRLLDGRSMTLAVDSASTSKEICQMLANKIKLRDTFGFSLYVSLFEKVWALGSGREHLMDAVSQCEQEVKRRGGQEQHAPWRLFFRKEVFAPWHDCSQDDVSTQLIYKQIIQGLKSGEYQTPKQDDLVDLTTKHLYIQHGATCGPNDVKAAVQDCISNTLLEAKSEAKWTQMVSTEHSQNPFVSQRKNPEEVKAELVDYARDKWPMLFSRFYEMVKTSGPALPKSKFIVAVNCMGITFLDERERKLLNLSYPEVTGVNISKEGKGSGQRVSLVTLKGDFTLSGTRADDMAELVTMFLSGLTERSQYALALKDGESTDDPTFLRFKKGDLIILVKDNEFAQQRGWIKGQSAGSGKTGAVPLEAILILPTLAKPSNEVMSLLNLPPNQRKNIPIETGTVERVAPATLREYSLQNFRQPTKDVNKQVMSRNAAPERLWVNSREPIRQPLLMKLIGNSELSHKACLAFTAILKYMGDYPTKQTQSPLDLTDQIFGPATQYEPLRDEIYCQIMKQMTNNNNRFSLDQGWQLLWLCCGLFPPSQSLRRHAQKFLETRPRETLASDCLQRMQNSLRMEPRKLPPHQVEVEAIQHNSLQILHKVQFPNDTEEIFAVNTTTKIKDLIQNITKKLKLASADGFSLFVKTHDKVLSLNETEYFFDSLRQITDWSKKSKRIKDAPGPTTISYVVFFMRKLWFNVVPGRDLEADLMFYFPQELPKYLRGYHVCTKEEMVSIAALLFRIKTNNDKTQLVTLTKSLKELVPADQLKAMSDNEWKKTVVAAFNSQGNMTVDEAKVSFLKMVYRWPTFGCAFFEVKQTSEPNFPDIVRIAISKQGLTIIHPKTKEVLANHPFNRIANWCSGSTYFHMTVGNLVKGSKFLCETSLGYKMDDLITSYVNMYLREKRALQTTRNPCFDI
uniref:Unconventional myosin-VIIa n=1 Tax=Knipowitschia caucasica TaxID=637954 RepID=A0AAV2KT89_KNICA